MAPMRPYERAASIREQLDRILSDPMNPLAPPASLNPPENATAANPAPTKSRKKPRTRSTALADAKNVLRAASAVTSKSLAVPQFIHRTPDLARHRRKCAVCHHPEREAIEDLFIHWHSPSSIASYYDDGDEESNERAITWVSIYRHAYAFGLDEIRRRNLRFAFELLLEQADQITPTSATLIAAARALGSCVNENGAWNEPPKRVLVTNIIRNESPQTTSADQIENHTELGNNGACVGADRNHRPASPQIIDDSSDCACPEPARRAGRIRERGEVGDSSVGASFLRDGFPSAGEGIVSSSAPACVVADRTHRPASPQVNGNLSSETGIRECSSDRARPESIAEGRDVVTSQPTSADGILGGQSLPAQAGLSSDTETLEKDSSFRACPDSSVGASHPREVVDSFPASLPPGFSASSEIRNSLNPFNSKEPPISNR